ncbi:MAG TPA: hypothetical protein DDZ88_04245 [Verrucomicrobiales bacterium]|nr:hypothetical protein [Verrucomicrobiales bacterium]
MNTPKQDCEQLMREFMPLAKQMLVAHGEFYPYGGVMRSDGSIVHLGAKEPGTDHPASRTLIEILQSHFRERAASNDIMASCLIFDVRIARPGSQDKTDAIQVNLDHQADYSVEVIFPYHLEQGAVTLDAPFAQTGAAQVFSKSPVEDPE